MVYTIDDALEVYFSGFKSREEAIAKNERLVGDETEFIMVYRETGESVEDPEIKARFYENMISVGAARDQNWERLRDPITGRIYGVKRIHEDGSETTVDDELGIQQLEANRRPFHNLDKSDADRLDLRRNMKEAADLTDICILEIGTQPVTKFDHFAVSKNKSRYLAIEKLKFAEHAVGISASQTTVDVALSEVNSAFLIMRGLSIPTAALYADTPMFEGTLSKFRDMRSRLWKKTIRKLPNAKDRIGPGPNVSTIEDLLRYNLELEPLITTRGDQTYIFLDRMSMREYLKKDKSLALNVNTGKEEFIYVEGNIKTDLGGHSSTVWQYARPRINGTLEGRAPSSGQNGEISHNALILGALSNQGESLEILDKYGALTVDDGFRRAKKSADDKGMKGRINGERISDLSLELVHAAMTGIENIGQNPFYLNELDRRARGRFTPAEIGADHFRHSLSRGLSFYEIRTNPKIY